MENQTTFSNPFDSVIDNDFKFENQELENVNRETTENSGISNSQPNFPPFFPIIYHDISTEIPQKEILLTRIAFFTAISISLSLCFTIIGSLFSFFMKSCSEITCFGAFKEIFLSIVQFIVQSTLLFCNQYFPFYISMRNETSNNSLIFVQIFTIFILFIDLLGIPGTGTIGIIYLYATFDLGTPINEFFASVISIWHFINFMLEIILYAMMKPIFQTKRNGPERIHLNA